MFMFANCHNMVIMLIENASGLKIKVKLVERKYLRLCTLWKSVFLYNLSVTVMQPNDVFYKHNDHMVNDKNYKLLL